MMHGFAVRCGSANLFGGRSSLRSSAPPKPPARSRGACPPPLAFFPRGPSRGREQTRLIGPRSAVVLAQTREGLAPALGIRDQRRSKPQRAGLEPAPEPGSAFGREQLEQARAHILRLLGPDHS